MRPLPLAVLALAALAAGCLVWGADEAPPPGGPAGPQPLTASLVAQPQACSLCHYAWEIPARFEGSVEETAEGWRYRLALAPVSAYNLTDVRVVPVVRGDETVNMFRFSAPGSVVRGQETSMDLHLPLPAGALHVLLAGDREFGRSTLLLDLADATIVGDGSVRGAALAPEGGLEAGHYTARVRYADGTPPSESFRLHVDAAPPGLRVVPHATAEAPAVFEFVLPERPRGFAVQLRPYNEHPTDKWMLPNWGDRGEVSLFVSEGTPAPPRNWTAEERSGPAEVVLHDHRVDGVIVRSQDARGEWTRQARWIVPPGEESPFPPLPPGTREIVAEITWSGRTPVSPTVAPYFSWAHHFSPNFYYPQPETDEPGRRVYRIPVDPAWWQEPGKTGGFQGFALLPLDERRSTVFDGSYGLKLTAVR